MSGRVADQLVSYHQVLVTYLLHVDVYSFMLQQMRRSGNKEENKRIIMDLDVVLKCHDYPYIVQCIGTFITPVSSMSYPNPVYCPRLVYNPMSVF